VGAELEYTIPFPDELLCSWNMHHCWSLPAHYVQGHFYGTAEIQKVSSVADSAPQQLQYVTVDARFLCGKALCFHQRGKMLSVLKW